MQIQLPKRVLHSTGITGSLLLIFSMALVSFTGCVTEKINSSENAPKPSPIDEDLQEEHRAQLKRLFKTHKKAIINGDIATLQELYRLPGNKKIKLEELKNVYREQGGRWAAMYQGASLSDEMPIFIDPARTATYPRAVFQGVIPLRLSNGQPVTMVAVYLDKEWKLLPPEVFQDSDGENN